MEEMMQNKIDETIKIIDIIQHRNKYYTQIFHVVDRMPKFTYEQKGNWLIGEDSGFFNFYFREAPWKRMKAFAGRKFTIPMKNGSIIEASGQWWDGIKPDYQGLLVSVGINTPERLNKCNVFLGMLADPVVLKWNKEPSNNYYKYDKRHHDFGKHKIQSKWEAI